MAARLFHYHDLVIVVLFSVMVLVLRFLIIFLFRKIFVGESIHLNLTKSESLELFWTVSPGVFLVVLGFVSLKNLYDAEVGDNVDFILKVTGHQWYWEYCYEANFSTVLNKIEFIEFLIYHIELINLDFIIIFWKKVFFITYRGVFTGLSSLFLEGDWFCKYDSYIIPEDYLNDTNLIGLKTGFRNQDVRFPCYLVRREKNEVLVSTVDVFHRWGVTDLGVKVDAVPGRENCLKVVPLRAGISFGFCYELCGAGHSQIPIEVFVGSCVDINWLIKRKILEREFVLDLFSSFTF